MRRYLLEKVRLIKQSEGERNFHILYQLCVGSSADEAAIWQLPPMSELHYLNQSGCYTLTDVDEVLAFKEMRHAMLVRHCEGVVV